MSFSVIPAIDLCDGEVVRLTRGDFEQKTVYHRDPVALAASFVAQGARRLHIVDLDGARDGKPRHADVIRALVAITDLDIEVGGGIRSIETAASYLDGNHSARYAILGTAALKSPELVKDACKRWPGRILIGIDAREGQVAVEGWLETSQTSAVELARAVADVGAAGIIYTDIRRDGTGTGPNIQATAALANACGLPVIASGGVACTEHIASVAAKAHEGIAGVVVGRAILSGDISVPAALAAAEVSGAE